MSLDPAVARAIGVDPAACQVSSHGGSGFSSTSRITTTVASPSATDDSKGGKSRSFFLKVGRGAESEAMFRGEHASLNAIHDAVPSLCPASLGHGPLEGRDGAYFLVTEFLDLTTMAGRRRGGGGGDDEKEDQGSGMSLAQKLAKLHTTPAPAPPGHDGRPMFGFLETTCCGDTPQDNGFRPSWADFYAENRLRAIWRRIQKNQGGADKKLGGLIETTASSVVPRLLGDGHLGGERGIVPVVVHGDLWSGNASRGRIGGADAVEDVVFDPSACYAHSEFDLGIMKMFGGFSGIMSEYQKLVPKTEPESEYEDRIALYEVYHHLNHYAIFGGGYRSGAISILERLVRKYEK